jgi:hypothetical protein
VAAAKGGFATRGEKSNARLVGKAYLLAIWADALDVSAAEIADGQRMPLASIMDEFGPNGRPKWSCAVRMMTCSPHACRQITNLRLHYEFFGRPKAIRKLVAAIENAAAWITESPDNGRLAPSLFHSLIRSDRRWLKVGPYWFVYVRNDGPAILANVF